MTNTLRDHPSHGSLSTIDWASPATFRRAHLESLRPPEAKMWHATKSSCSSSAFEERCLEGANANIWFGGTNGNHTHDTSRSSNDLKSLNPSDWTKNVGHRWRRFYLWTLWACHVGGLRSFNSQRQSRLSVRRLREQQWPTIRRQWWSPLAFSVMKQSEISRRPPAGVLPRQPPPEFPPRCKAKMRQGKCRVFSWRPMRDEIRSNLPVS